VETLGPDPELAAPLARCRVAPEAPNVTLLRLQFPPWRWADGDYVDRERRRLVKEFIHEGPGGGQFDRPIQWFYDPMAVPAFLGQMDETLTVYDCMDELSKFAYAPPEISEREAELLAAADLVFTGGRKLYEAKSRSHSNCHFYGCGVDYDHFGKARLQSTEVPAQLAALPKPRLGYIGVIDERMDANLVAALADANPNWSVVMVGPVLKIDAAALPKRPNLHWLGRQDYSALPNLCRGLDVCLMPFALNESTEYINPTKALEYMATGRVIVSTAVPDVVTNFGSVVKVAHSQDEFVRLCVAATEQPDAGAVERGLKMASENTWEFIVSELENHLAEALAKTRTRVAI
jgi:glycosyltransferase involved in cell wall biosynthesis